MHVAEKGVKQDIFNKMTKLTGKVTNEAQKKDTFSSNEKY